MLALLRTQLPGCGLRRGHRFLGPRPEGVSLLLQFLDLRHQRGSLPLSRDQLGLKVSTTKAEVLHFRTPRRQKPLGIGKQALLPPELVPDIPLPS